MSKVLNKKDELIRKYINSQREIMKEVFIRYNVKITSERKRQIEEDLVQQEKNIREVLRSGLDIGTIARDAVPVTLAEYKGNICFKTKEGQYFRIYDTIAGKTTQASSKIRIPKGVDYV